MTDHTGDDDRHVVIERSGIGLVGFIAGLAVGAGLALLFAPQSGEETRRDLARRGRRLGARAQEVAGDLRDRARDGMANAQTRLDDGLQSARDTVNRGRRKVAGAAASGRQAAQHAREDLERRLGAAKSAYRAGMATDAEADNDASEHDE